MTTPEDRPLRLPWWRAAATIVMSLVLIPPTMAWAGHQFGDVPNSNIFHDDIEWMADNEVTSGCGGGDFCPSDTVTREQMSAFMRRLESRQVFLPADAKAADADTLDGLDSTDFLLTTGKAFDADRLDGLDSTSFLRANAQAVDADKLDGQDSSAFLGVGDTAADSDLLDGRAPVAFEQRLAVVTESDAPTGVADGVSHEVSSLSVTAPAAGTILVQFNVYVELDAAGTVFATVIDDARTCGTGTTYGAGYAEAAVGAGEATILNGAAYLDVVSGGATGFKLCTRGVGGDLSVRNSSFFGVWYPAAAATSTGPQEYTFG